MPDQLDIDDSNTTKRRRQTRKQNMVSINLRISPFQLKMIDQAAKTEYTTRSQLIRTAVNYYLRPSSKLLTSVDDYVLDTIKHRRDLAASNKWHTEHSHEINVYDG